jgi:hypothetical protein
MKDYVRVYRERFLNLMRILYKPFKNSDCDCGLCNKNYMRNYKE